MTICEDWHLHSASRLSLLMSLLSSSSWGESRPACFTGDGENGGLLCKPAEMVVAGMEGPMDLQLAGWLDDHRRCRSDAVVPFFS